MILTILSIAGITIITGLAYYAYQLTSQVKAVEKQQQEEATLAASNLRTRQQELINDIHFVARSVLAEQCEITEGVLRVHYLIHALDPETWQLDNLRAIREHHHATSNMPILDTYQKLPRKEQFQLDKKRWQLEADNKTNISTELDWLVSHTFPKVTLLH